MIQDLWDLPQDSIGPMIGLIVIIAIVIWSWRERRQS